MLKIYTILLFVIISIIFSQTTFGVGGYVGKDGVQYGAGSPAEKAYEKSTGKKYFEGGEDVKKIQKTLGVTVDGKWGPETQAAYDKKYNTSTATNNSAKCSGENSLCSSSFMIDTKQLGLGGTNINTGGTAKNTIDNGLAIIVNKLMIAFGVLALFIITIGGGYMIFAHGQDGMLTKGKFIFNFGLIALLIALSSGIIMKIIISLLY